MADKQMKLKKLLAVFCALLVVMVMFFMYDYYNPSNLDALDEQLISFEKNQDGTMVSLVSDYDIPLFTSIRYTTDGSLPTKDSPKYTDPVDIQKEGRNGTVIRAAIFRGKASTQVYTKTFFTSPSSMNQGVYTVCISTDARNLYSDEIGIMALGAATQEEANANEAIPQDPRGPLRANYSGRGIEWERPVTVEIYSSQGDEVLVQNAGIRLAGANSRRFPVKSLSLFARKAYDDKGVFELDILNQNTALMGNKVTTYNHLDLRSGGNNFYYTMLPDTIMRQAAYDGGFDVVGTAVPAAVYINGEYYALMWIQPDYCERNIAEMAGLDGNAIIRTVKGFEGSATDGTAEGYQDYKDMYEFASSADFTKAEERAKLEEILDIDNCLMYYFLEIYASNNDWPQNNYGLWRCLDPAASDPENKYADGRWRFMLYDTDNAFSTFVDQIEGFDYVLGMQMSPMFVNLMKSKEYSQRFVNIVCDFMSTSTKKENIHSTYMALKDLIQPEMDWRNENSAPIDFDEGYIDIMHVKLAYHIDTRQGIIDQRLRDYFGAVKKYYLCIDTVPQGVTVNLNTREITSGNSGDGYYYKDMPATLSCTLADGYELESWTINGINYYEKEILLDDAVVTDSECDIRVNVKKSVSDAKLLTLSWGSIARFVDIYNPGTEDINLGQYTISEDKNAVGYALPQLTLKAGETFRVYFKDDKTASLGDHICGINVKEGKTIYLMKNGEETDHVFVPQFIEGYMLGKSQTDGSWKYIGIKEGN